MHKPPRFITPHGLARLIAWAQAMLAWVAAVLFTDSARIDRRHLRQRYHRVSLRWAERLIWRLVMARAAEIAGLCIKRRPPRNAAPSGFRRRTARGALIRAIAGSRLRKALKHRDVAQHLQCLIAALAGIDALARRYLVKRALRGLTRIHAVLMYAPAADAVIALTQPAPCAADSS